MIKGFSIKIVKRDGIREGGDVFLLKFDFRGEFLVKLWLVTEVGKKLFENVLEFICK